MNRDEPRWTEMNRDEMRWTEMNPDEPRWTQMNPDEMRWTEMNRDEPRWNEMKWDEPNWNEMKWVEMRWNEMKWDEMSNDIVTTWTVKALLAGTTAMDIGQSFSLRSTGISKSKSLKQDLTSHDENYEMTWSWHHDINSQLSECVECFSDSQVAQRRHFETTR